MYFSSYNSATIFHVPMVYRPLQVLARQTAGGVITGVDYHDGRGLVPLSQFVPDPATKASFARTSWIVTDNLNCYAAPNGDYFGADDIEPDPWKTKSDVVTCQQECVKTIDCTGFIWGKRSKNCHLKKNINPRQCYYSSTGALYQLN